MQRSFQLSFALQMTMNARGYTTACYIDYAKAFDFINTCLLSFKILEYGVEWCPLQFSQFFLPGGLELLRLAMLFQATTKF